MTICSQFLLPHLPPDVDSGSENTPGAGEMTESGKRLLALCPTPHPYLIDVALLQKLYPAPDSPPSQLHPQ